VDINRRERISISPNSTTPIHTSSNGEVDINRRERISISPTQQYQYTSSNGEVDINRGGGYSISPNSTTPIHEQ